MRIRVDVPTRDERIEWTEGLEPRECRFAWATVSAALGRDAGMADRFRVERDAMRSRWPWVAWLDLDVLLARRSSAFEVGDVWPHYWQSRSLPGKPVKPLDWQKAIRDNDELPKGRGFAATVSAIVGRVDGGTGVMTFGQRVLAHDVGITPKTIRAALVVLEDGGWLSRASADSRTRPDRITLLIPDRAEPTMPGPVSLPSTRPRAPRPLVEAGSQW